ncbi:unnamed protein product [Trichobilharzia regenti]|nr:unnamed protein product [Trichobilharzia regenti]
MKNKKLSKEIDVENCHLCIDSGVYQKSLGVMNYPVKLNKREPRKQNTIVIVTHTTILENGVNKDVYLLLQRPKTGKNGGAEKEYSNIYVYYFFAFSFQ